MDDTRVPSNFILSRWRKDLKRSQHPRIKATFHNAGCNLEAQLQHKIQKRFDKL